MVLNITGHLRGKYTLEVKEDGLYLANLKKDTVVGSMQHTGNTKHTRITQEQLKLQLDSLNKLVKERRIFRPAAKNYFITPGKIGKSTNLPRQKFSVPFTRAIRL